MAPKLGWNAVTVAYEGSCDEIINPVLLVLYSGPAIIDYLHVYHFIVLVTNFIQGKCIPSCNKNIRIAKIQYIIQYSTPT